MENYDFVPVKDALLLTSVYLSAAAILCLLGWLWYRDYTKASLAAFLLLGFHFFFGGIHDLIRANFPGSFVTKYSFILPAAGIFLITAFILIRKRKNNFPRLRFYLNIVLLLLLVLDAGLLAGKMIGRKKVSVELPAGFTACDTCTRPDIYLILADEYAGESELKEVFKFDNSVFQRELSTRGFHTIPDSYSNYNYTPFSIASLLNMEYLELGSRERQQPDLTYCYQKIRDNRLWQFLANHQYELYNYSVFDFEGQPKRVLETFLPAKTRLITSQTFLSRFDRDIRFNLLTRFNFKSDLNLLTYANKKNNQHIFSLTKDIAQKRTSSPKFVYSHLMMPHYPYYYDRNGVEQPFDKLVEGNQINQAAYIEYLQYTNKKILELVDHIRQSSATPPIIVLIGDHGFRHFTQPMESKYYFLNLSSVYLPSGNYGGFRDSLTGVNFFRALLNTQFRQQLPYLKDSTSYLKD